MNSKYIEEVHREFCASDEAKSLFDKISQTCTNKRENILEDVNTLARRAGLAYALIALFRQQVKSGFVLGDPLKLENKEEKKIFDPHTGITFRLQWNPDRELRMDHELLIKRGVITKNIDDTKLINRNKSGKACYLCKANIDAQNPGEILFEMELAGDSYYAGANFAYITNNHFTIISAKHRPQQYSKKILKVLNDFIDKADNYFRGIFNGLAGASIKEHEHLQVTTENFPIEEIRIENKDVVYRKNDIRVSQPNYYTQVWVVEGTNKSHTVDEADKIIRKWHNLDGQNHTENILITTKKNLFRTFIILRDKRKLSGTGKSGLTATFETGGNIVLSCQPKVASDKQTNERKTFDKANIETIKQLLNDISPEKQLTEEAVRKI